MHYLISLLLSITLLFSISPLTSAFSGNFELSDIVVSSPCQVDPKSTASTYIERESGPLIISHLHLHHDEKQ
jgi:hypothetical protein